MIYITGDTHRDFKRIEEFCEKQNTSKDDLMIVQGDAGINYYGGWRDQHVKRYLESQPISFLFQHGNHEMRPETIATYRLVEYPEYKGSVYQEDAYPSLAFAVDGSIYEFDGQKMLICGGAYSVDKYFRLAHGLNWWADEQPSVAAKQMTEENLSQRGPVQYVLTHTCPLRFSPTEAFLPMINQNTVDNSTERWLDTIYELTPEAKWLCGHFHIDKLDGNVRFMYRDVISIPC